MVNIRQHLIRAGRAVLADVKRPPYVAPGHYYSPRSSASDIERAIKLRRPPVGVDLRQDEQLALARRLAITPVPVNRWQTDRAVNKMYGAVDGAVLRAMLLDLRPQHFYEVGSGFSTAVALDVSDTDLPDLRITCVEPYPERLLGRLRPGDRDRLTLIQSPVQDVDPERIAAAVQPGDILFIDSTHVVKGGSDVVWLLLYTLPLLQPGVVVHVHDIHWPFEYSDRWLRQGRDWNEAYLLHAFLIHNEVWQLMLFNHWLLQVHPESLPAELRGGMAGSLWMRRVK